MAAYIVVLELANEASFVAQRQRVIAKVPECAEIRKLRADAGADVSVVLVESE